MTTLKTRLLCISFLTMALISAISFAKVPSASAHNMNYPGSATLAFNHHMKGALFPCFYITASALSQSASKVHYLSSFVLYEQGADTEFVQVTSGSVDMNSYYSNPNYTTTTNASSFYFYRSLNERKNDNQIVKAEVCVQFTGGAGIRHIQLQANYGGYSSNRPDSASDDIGYLLSDSNELFIKFDANGQFVQDSTQPIADAGDGSQDVATTTDGSDGSQNVAYDPTIDTSINPIDEG